MADSNDILCNITIAKTAFSGADFKEAIDFALVNAAFDLKVTICFIDLGVYNLKKSQNADALLDKTYTDLLKGLEFYDIEHLWVERESLRVAGLVANDLIDSVSIVSREAIKQSNKLAHHLVTF